MAPAMWNQRKFAYFFVACLLLSAALSTAAVADAIQEYQVKTAFIYHFTNYIDWSKNPEKMNKLEPFIISVIGDSPILKELEALAKSKTVQGRKIEVFSIKDSSQLRSSHIVLFASSSEKNLQEVLNKVKGSGTLVVSHAEGFASKGAMINFFIEDGRLRFEVNRVAIEAEHLQVSSQLLKLARLVE